jgi:predicted RecA/RadA family phage recombinase
VRVSGSDFTTAANTNLQAITGLTWTIPANTALNIPFSCHILWSQATAANAVSFGIQDVTVAPTRIDVGGVMVVSATTGTAWQSGTLVALNSTTATAIVTGTPSAITTTWQAELHGVIEAPSNASSSAINIMVKTANSANVVSVKRGSFCTVAF